MMIDLWQDGKVVEVACKLAIDFHDGKIVKNIISNDEYE